MLYAAYRNFERELMLYQIKDKKQINLTQTGVSEFAPYWSPDGKYIYFTTNRSKPSYPFGLRESDIYRLPLQRYDQPFRSNKFAELFKEQEKEKKEEKTDSDTGTYRWIIFTSGKGLVDGSFYRLPSWGCYTLDGKNIEKTGVEPHIYVKNSFKDRLLDEDPQLKRAIEELMGQLK